MTLLRLSDILLAHSPEQQRQLAPLGGLVWSKRQPTTRFLEALQQRALHRTRQRVPAIVWQRPGVQEVVFCLLT